MLGHRIDVEEVHARERIAIEQTADHRLYTFEGTVQMIGVDVVFADRHATELTREARAVHAQRDRVAAQGRFDGTNA